jgi:hypothetical protein
VKRSDDNVECVENRADTKRVRRRFIVKSGLKGHHHSHERALDLCVFHYLLGAGDVVTLHDTEQFY